MVKKLILLGVITGGGAFAFSMLTKNLRTFDQMTFEQKQSRAVKYCHDYYTTGPGSKTGLSAASRQSFLDLCLKRAESADEAQFYQTRDGQVRAEFASITNRRAS